MVELLTVMGIIALLIAILMPTLNKARQASQMIVCRSNLHQIYQASLMFATEHKGVMQIAGKMVDANATPEDIGDPQQTLYAYYTDKDSPESMQRPMPLPTALALYLGSRLRTDSGEDLVADFENPTCGARKVFTCPAQFDQITLGTTVSGQNDGWYGPRLPISYAFNEGVLGFENGSDRRLRGRYINAKPSSEVLFMTDAVPRTDPQQSAYIAWYPSESGRYTLADALDDEGMAMYQQFDLSRHHGKINVAYFDGHVDALYINDTDLQHAAILSQ